MTLVTDRLSWLGLRVIILASVLGVSGCLGGMPEPHTPTATPVPPPTPTPSRYETCPSFDPDEVETYVGLWLPRMPSEDVTLHPDLVGDTIEAIKRALKGPYTIKELEIEEAGEAIAVTVTDTGGGVRMGLPTHKLGDGRELYHHIRLWGSATFEDGSEISFHVWVWPVLSGRQCEIQGVRIFHEYFSPI